MKTEHRKYKSLFSDFDFDEGCARLLNIARQMPMPDFLAVLHDLVWEQNTPLAEWLPVKNLFMAMFSLLSFSAGLISLNAEQTEGTFDMNVFKNFPVSQEWEAYVSTHYRYIFIYYKDMEEMKDSDDNSERVWYSLLSLYNGLDKVWVMFSEAIRDGLEDGYNRKEPGTFVKEGEGSLNEWFWRVKVHVYDEDGTKTTRDIIMKRD